MAASGTELMVGDGSEAAGAEAKGKVDGREGAVVGGAVETAGALDLEVVWVPETGPT